MRLIDVKIVLKFLGTIQPYEEIVKLVTESIHGQVNKFSLLSLENLDEDDRMQKKILLRTIPLLGSDAFLDILKFVSFLMVY